MQMRCQLDVFRYGNTTTFRFMFTAGAMCIPVVLYINLREEEDILQRVYNGLLNEAVGYANAVLWEHGFKVECN